MRESPLVSILTPSYNQGRYLRGTLESVARQRYPAIEHVVWDGGSTDDTPTIVADYAGRITFVSAPDDGQADALNKAFARSTGEIIGWLNSDDFYLTRGVVERVVEIFERHPSVDVVYGDAVWVDSENVVLKVSPRPEFDPERLRRFDFISQPATFFRRALIEPPLVDDRLHYVLDYALWLRLLRAGATFRRLPVPLAAMRRHDDAKSVLGVERLWSESETVRLGHGRRPTATETARDLMLMVALKARGLAAFHGAALGRDEWTLPLALPPVGLRPFYQAGLTGGGRTSLLFPRYVLRKLLTTPSQAGR